MKKMTVVLMVCGFMIGLVYADGDVTAPGDEVIGIPNNNNWPGGEIPEYAIDNDPSTKYLHFRDQEDQGEVGIVVTPAIGATVVQGIALSSAGDAAGRDPIDFELYGSNGLADVGPWTLIATGPVPDFMGDEWPRNTPTVTPMFFANDDSYVHYRLMFPTMRGGINELFQIAEIELLEKPTNGWPPSVKADPALSLLNIADVTTLDFDATIEDVDSTSFTIVWSQVSGPATVDFNGTENDEDPTVTCPAVKGVYVLQVDVTDETGNAAAPKQVVVRVWDPAIDEQLISHWPLDEVNGVAFVEDLAGDYDRGFLGNYNDTHHDPNFVAGWVTLPGATINNAGDFQDAGYIEVVPDANAIGDPNMTNLDAGVTVASWVYANDWDGNRRVLQYGEPTDNDNQNIFRMLHEYGELKFDAAPGRGLTANIFPSGQWHHMAGTYDGMSIKLYIDGIEVASETYDTYAPLRDYVGQVLTIGAKSRLVNYEDYPGDYMSGMLDDVRVYSYAIGVDTVRSLVELGQNSAPGVEVINAPGQVILTDSTVDVSIDAVIYDAHEDTITYMWEQLSPQMPEVVFSSTTVEDPLVTFAEAGTYVLRLTIDDGVYGLSGTVYKDVEIVVADANCDKINEDGLLYAADLNKDCYVNIDDFALMALDWLACNDPQDVDCTNPYLQ